MQLDSSSSRNGISAVKPVGATLETEALVERDSVVHRTARQYWDREIVGLNGHGYWLLVIALPGVDREWTTSERSEKHGRSLGETSLGAGHVIQTAKKMSSSLVVGLMDRTCASKSIGAPSARSLGWFSSSSLQTFQFRMASAPRSRHTDKTIVAAMP